MTNTTVANTREEVTAVMDVKMQELETAQAEIKQAIQDVQDIKQEGNETVAEMQEQINELKESMKVAENIGEIKLLDKQVEGLEKDAKLQGMLVTGAVAKKKEELEQAFMTFFGLYKEASRAFKTLDKEYEETMSMRTYAEDVAKVDGYGNRINHLFSITARNLHSQGFVKQGQATYKGVHLSPTGLYSESAMVRKAMSVSLSSNSAYARHLPENSN